MVQTNLDGYTGEKTGEMCLTVGWNIELEKREGLLAIRVYDKRHSTYPSGYVESLHIRVADIEEALRG